MMGLRCGAGEKSWGGGGGGGPPQPLHRPPPRLPEVVLPSLFGHADGVLVLLQLLIPAKAVGDFVPLRGDIVERFL